MDPWDTMHVAKVQVVHEILSYRDIYYNPLSWRFLPLAVTFGRTYSLKVQSTNNQEYLAGPSNVAVFWFGLVFWLGYLV